MLVSECAVSKTLCHVDNASRSSESNFIVITEMGVVTLLKLAMGIEQLN